MKDNFPLLDSGLIFFKIHSDKFSLQEQSTISGKYAFLMIHFSPWRTNLIDPNGFPAKNWGK